MSSGAGPDEELERPSLVPDGIDPSRPSVARVYDVFLGGKDHYKADREVAAQIIRDAPEVPAAARQSRAFLQRAVHYLTAEEGIRQFIDVGAGLPAAGAVHQVARRTAPEARVVYVDNDPMVLSHARALLVENTSTTTVVDADARDPAAILGAPELRRLLNLDKPVGVLLVAILHFVTDEQARRMMAAFTAAVAPGSFLVISHATAGPHPDRTRRAAASYSTSTAPITLRDTDQLAQFFTGWDLIHPGLVPAEMWRPEIAGCGLRRIGNGHPDADQMTPVLAGVARKPG